MSRALNRIDLIGNVGSDPEIIATSKGTRIAKFSLATNRQWADASGQKQESTQWHRVTIFGKLVDIVEQWVKKGDRLYVSGRIEYSQTEGDDGVKRYWCDVVVNDLVMLGSSGGDGMAKQAAPATGGGGGTPASNGDPDDDLPFSKAW